MTKPAVAAAGALATPLCSHFTHLPTAWRQLLAPVLSENSLAPLAQFVDGRVAQGCTVFPARPLAALQAVEPARVRVVILGQDPYHGAGQAHGLAFSVPAGVRPPPSLRNILLEVARDGRAAPRPSGDLSGWSAQGVLLLNTVLTVEEGEPASHAGCGWEPITDAIIGALAAQAGPRVFLLWGRHAQSKSHLIRAPEHLVLQANHPSPLSARRPPLPFLGCGHFSAANRFLVSKGCAAIDWSR